jgi:acyl carrier protein
MQKITNLVLKLVSEIAEVDSILLKMETKLIGSASMLDSLLLVELCVRLENELKMQELEFDWISEKAMSNHASMFSSIGALIEEIKKQNKI